jgi:kinesin family protein C2/C3
VGEYTHPQLGVLPTYLFENQRNTRLYFDDQSGQWARMPLQWEFNVPSVMTAIQAMDEALPSWNNVHEQLLVLRECDYDVNDAIAFGEINFRHTGGGMSSADMTRLSQLEEQLAYKNRLLRELEQQQEEEKTTAVRQLTREKTRVEGLEVRRERANVEAQVSKRIFGPVSLPLPSTWRVLG